MEDSASHANAIWAQLEEVARPAREKRRLNPSVRDGLITALCAQTPLSVRELALLLHRTEAYTGDAIRPLIEQNRLTFLYPEQPRHPKQRYLTPGSTAAEEAERIRAADQRKYLPPDSEVPAAEEAPTPISLDDKDVEVLAAIAQSRWAELEQLARPARDNRYLAGAELGALLESIATIAPVSPRELAILTDRREEQVREILDALLAHGRMRLLHADAPGHPRQKYYSVLVGRTSAKAPPAAPRPVTDDVPFQVSLPEPRRVDEADEQPVVVNPSPGRAAEAAYPGASIPNTTTNLVVATVSGLLLGVARPPAWWLYAMIVAVALAAVHAVTNSSQYQRYKALDPSRGRAASFLVFKGLVAYLEITAVYLVVSLITR